jgi:hypothetical protein
MGCSAIEVTSQARQTEIEIDGKDNEWLNKITYYEKEKIGVGIQNDGENFYVCIKTIDRATKMKMMMMGMTVWFDNKGGSDKTFGIRFPIGTATGMNFRDPMNSSETEMGMSSGNSSRRGFGLSEPNISALQKEVDQMLGEIEVIGPGRLEINRVRTINSQKTYGIKTSIHDTLGAMTYELLIPLKTKEQFFYSIETEAGKEIGVGFETGDVLTPTMPSGNVGMSGGGSPGGMGGGSPQGGMGGSQGRMPRQSQEMSNKISLWMKVKLVKF